MSSRTDILKSRGAGILMHITSLPSRYGIGDVGLEARNFADFLKDAGQKFWQILPLTPIDFSQSFSPYSSSSAFAMNILLISPDLLAEEGLLNKNHLKKYVIKNSDKVNFLKAVQIKLTLLEIAFIEFKESDDKRSQNDFQIFCERNKTWLDDFALYCVIKTHQNNQPWYKWPIGLKKRKEIVLEKYKNECSSDLEKIKWFQFKIHEQWIKLKKYCSENEIFFIGDLPFYVGYDSVDVWTHQNLFSLKNNGELKSVAGVPPDYFNANGQLWGMPVFNWKQHKKTGFNWWIKRIEKNLELSDIIRLDHFRAFADYWEVPAGHKNAKRGKWRQGPGEGFFTILKNKIGNLPFIAEDLGDITPEVIALRKKLNLPGMKILQFAFGGEPGENSYLPHQYESNAVVYTGTHDNNTTLGWFEKDITAKEKRNLSMYIAEVTKKNVADKLIRLAYSSVANIAIVPMQDILGLGYKARMNVPASTENNWAWQMTDLSIRNKSKQLKTLVAIYGR